MNEPRNEEENLDEFNKCTIENCHCGYKGENDLCLHKERCAYQLSEKWISIHAPNEKSTIEIISETIKKHGKCPTQAELFAIIPKAELEEFVGTDRSGKRFRSFFVVDTKGNILNLRNGNEIRRNWKL
jgi:hypothetical protein